jgi:hypothetical protein
MAETRPERERFEINYGEKVVSIFFLKAQVGKLICDNSIFIAAATIH